ncbi:serine-rich adhesin for platelets-like [Haliotis rubra]|uniref:serine-rich adhesin for platelets-like n=1 Tax=Haliotis rubra TaxID=36100 RepID=UPI001EE5093D|nr:serine-rich adhesin for platelets-like [Haliotis rubra]XP_046559421.1 serine-rich adhesin for platelets-like [Haliotis rubra]XP_046559426.1 serine-rich adhesin for platelets-like [Haliotis rubra]XP_046559434.1 serine-rich adhesin for platelets-like [Haliotis rubra]XP_046559441.1 serine-rich adhesin for platelets-like [Haliotis rubra]XP_046559447.1 serine-rich adhesin for platelets-like [Haliotis rubra]XP_046559454.1 serine-rich adhesin for platelets-like [Haliotis rubra]
MHDNSEWNRSVHRNNYWRPSQGLYLPNEDRRWEPNGRSAAHGFPRYSDSYRHRHTDQRSHDFKWHSYPRHSCQGQSFGAAIQPSMPMAPRHRKRKGRDRGGSRPFPSKLVEKITGDSTAASTVSSSSSHTSSSHNKDSASTLSSTKHQSSSLSSHKFFGANPSSRPDDNRSKSGESSMQGASLNLNLHSADVPTRPPVSSSGTISKSSTSSSSTAVATAASTSSSLSSLSSSTKLPKSLPNIAQTHSVSVSSNNLPKVKILKHSSPATSKPIPMSTLAYCESIPQLRDVLHKTPVVMLERLTEKLIRMQLKHNGLCLKGDWHKMLHKQRKKNSDVQKKAEKKQKKKSLKLIFSLNSKGMLDKKKHKIKKDSFNHKNNKNEILNSENMLDTKDSITSSSLLVDPKVMSLSRPLQSAYSNNASMTNMPFKNSGRVKTPSKTFHPKPTGPLPKHMQMFDLDKLRTKLKGANFGGSGRKPGPFLETNLDIHNTEILRSSSDVPMIMSKISTPSSEATDIISPMSGLDDNMIVRSDVREDMNTDDGSVGSDSVHSSHSDSQTESNIGTEMAPGKEHIDAHDPGHKESEVSSVCVIDKCAADSSGDATDFHSGEDRDQSVDGFSGSSDSWSIEGQVIGKEPELSSVPTLVPETVHDTVVDSAVDSSDILSISADGLKEREQSKENGDVEVDESVMQLENITKDMHNEVDSSLKLNDSPVDRKECSPREKDEYFPDKKSLDKAAATESNAAESTVPKLDSGTHCTANDKDTLVETRSVDCNLQSSDGMARDAASSLEQHCSVSKDSNDNVMFVDNDDRSQEIGHTTDRTCEKEELSSQQTVPRGSQETDPIPDERDQVESVSVILVGSAVKSPHSLSDICHGILKKQDMHLRLPSSEGDGDTQVIEANVQLENARVSENPETSLNNEERENNSQCLSDKSNKDSVAVDITSSVAIDLSSSRTDDDLSPVCIISSVESGAHIYFSETDTDLKPNTKTNEQKERKSGQTSLATISQPQSITSDTVITNTVSSTGIVSNTGQSTHDTTTPTSSGIQDFFHDGLVTNSYPVIVTSSIPVYPIPDVQPVLLTSQNMTLPRHSGPKPNKKESKVVSKPRTIKPKGSEPSSFVQMAVPQVPSFPMFLPTIPSAFPPEAHSDKTHHDDFIVDTHVSDCTLTMQNKHEQSGNITDTVEQASVTDATTDGAHDDNIDATHSHTLTKPEDSKMTKSSPNIPEASMLADGTIINNKTLTPDRINNGVCQMHKTQDQMTRVVSDLDVMRYDDEPPVLEKVNNSDNWAVGEPKMQPLDSDASFNLSDQDMRKPEALLESTTSVVCESSEAEKQDQTYIYVIAESESSTNTSTNPSSNEATECCIKS